MAEDKKSAKTLAIGIGIFFILLMCIAGYFATRQYFTDLQLQNTDQQQVIVPTSQDSTANWNTLNSSEFGFQLKYPNNFFDAGHEPRIHSIGKNSMPGTSNTVTINGISYHHYEVGDAAMGHRYFYDYYQVERNGINLVIDLETSETACENYLPLQVGNTDQEKNYNACVVHRNNRIPTLQQITNTFTFIK